MIIRLQKEVLTDGSNVFNVWVDDDDLNVTFHCVSFDAAMDLIRSIEKNTVDVEETILDQTR